MAEQTIFQINGRSYPADECRAAFGTVPEPSPAKAMCLDMLQGRRIIDIGCGLGYFVAMASERFPESHVAGAEYFEDNFNAARFLFGAGNDRFHHTSVYDLTFEDGTWDCVTFQAVIEHLEQAALAVKEINRVMTPGGHLIVTTDNPYALHHMYGFFRNECANIVRRLLTGRARLEPAIFNPQIEYARHIYAWIPSTLLALLVVNGFEYVEHRYAPAAKPGLKRLATLLLPFTGDILVMKVRKISEAPRRFV